MSDRRVIIVENEQMPSRIVQELVPGKEITIAQIDLLNRGDGAANNIKWVEFYASNNNSEWDKIGAGDFNDEGTRATFRYYVKSTKARYLKLIIPEGYGNNCPPAAIRELTVYGLEGNN